MNQLVDEIFSISMFTTLDKVFALLSTESTGRVGKLEWPEEVGSLFEIWSDSEDFVDQIFNTNDSVRTKGSFNDTVVRDRDSLFVDLGETTFVDEFTDSLQVGISIYYLD